MSRDNLAMCPKPARPINGHPPISSILLGKSISDEFLQIQENLPGSIYYTSKAWGDGIIQNLLVSLLQVL